MSDDSAASAAGATRPPRVAFLLLRGLDHFTPDLLRALNQQGLVEARGFFIAQDGQGLAEALAWADDPSRDAVWFEFAWPPFTRMIGAVDLGGRRVIVRVHRIEAYGSRHAADVLWEAVDDVIVVGAGMAEKVRPMLEGRRAGTRLHVIHNGVDVDLFQPQAEREPFRIGWCGWFSLHKNPIMALQVLRQLHDEDPRWSLHIATRSPDAVVADSFMHLARRLQLAPSIHVTENLPHHLMPAWHARNRVLLSTSVYESFGFAIAEAAAAGCDLALLDYPGADEFWPAEVRFGTPKEAASLIEASQPNRWRGLVSSRFALTQQAGRVAELVRGARDARPAASQTTPLAFRDWSGRFVVRRPQDHIEGHIRRTGRFYEEAMLMDLQARLAGGLFVDAGANVGNHTLFAAGVGRAPVLAFEPSPELADQMEETLRLNGLEQRVRVVRKGLGARSGRARLAPGPMGNHGMARLAIDPGGDVPVTSLDEELDEGARVAVLKVDVEGMELEVLQGAEAMLRRDRPVIYAECADVAALRRVGAFLVGHGYAPMARFNATPTFRFDPA